MKRSKTPEGVLRGQCLEWLSMNGVFAWKNNTQGVFDPTKGVFRRFEGLKGVSDILGILPPHVGSWQCNEQLFVGRILAVETKIRPKKPTAEQEYFLERVNENGGLGLLIYDLNELIKAVEETK